MLLLLLLLLLLWLTASLRRRRQKRRLRTCTIVCIVKLACDRRAAMVAPAVADSGAREKLAIWRSKAAKTIKPKLPLPPPPLLLLLLLLLTMLTKKRRAIPRIKIRRCPKRRRRRTRMLETKALPMVLLLLECRHGPRAPKRSTRPPMEGGGGVMMAGA